MMKRNGSEASFWIDVDKSHNCWKWEGSHNSHGYGKLWLDGKTVAAHRFAWSLVNGEIPNGLCVLHKCDNPGCVNPDHLFLGTNQDNSDDMVKKGRQKGGQRFAS